MTSDIIIAVLEQKPLIYFPTSFHEKPRLQNQKP